MIGTSPSNNNNILMSVATTVAVAVGTVTILSFLVSKSLFRKGPQQKNQKRKQNKDDRCNVFFQKESWESHVKDHGSLREIWPETLYVLEAQGCDRGPPVRNMIIYRLPVEAATAATTEEQEQEKNTNIKNINENHQHQQQEKQRKNRPLLVYNAIAVREETLEEIVSLGVPSVMIVPNYMHRCCAAVWKHRFPHLQVVCPEIAKKQVSEIVPVDMSIDEFTNLKEWSKWVHSKLIDGWGNFENVIEVDLPNDNNSNIQQSSPSSTWSIHSSTTKKAMIVCDLLFTVPYKKNASYGERFLIWLFDSSIDLPSDGSIIVPKVARISRILAIKDWSKAEKWYRNYAQENGKHIASILVGHGPPVVEVNPAEGCTKAFEGIADQLTKPRW